MPPVVVKYPQDYCKKRWEELRKDYPELKDPVMGQVLDMIQPDLEKGAEALEGRPLRNAKMKAEAVLAALQKADGNLKKIKDPEKQKTAKSLLVSYKKEIMKFESEVDKAIQKEDAAPEEPSTDDVVRVGQELEARKQEFLKKEAEKKKEVATKIFEDLTLDSILDNSNLLQEFHKHCQKEHCAEQLAFLIGLKKGMTKKGIFNMFIKQDSPKEINVAATMRQPLWNIASEAERLAAAGDNGGADSKWNELNFDVCKGEVVNILNAQPIPKFKKAKIDALLSKS
jgi:hypothetical protein